MTLLRSKNETKDTLRVNLLFTVIEELIGRIHVWRMFVLDGMFFFFFCERRAFF